MFTINQGFDLNSPQFNFKRDYFATVAELKAADENGFPDHFITNVGGVLYQLTKSNSVDTTTGKWRKVKLGSDVDLSKYGTSLGITPGDDHANSTNIDLVNGTTKISSINLKQVNTINAGLMSVADKAKLDGIDKDHIVYNDQDNTISGDLTIEGKIKSTDTDITVDTGKIQFNSSSDGILFSGSEDATYLKIDGKNSSDTKVYNTNGGVTDVSVYAKSTDVSSTYAKKSEAVSNININTNGQSLFITKTINGANSTINVPIATTTTDGVMSVADKKKLDGIAANANNYSLPTASTTVKGGVQLGYTATGKNYPLNVDSNGKAYVNVPWTDTKTDISDCAKLSKDNAFSGVNRFKTITTKKGIFTIADNGASITNINYETNLSITPRDTWIEVAFFNDEENNPNILLASNTGTVSANSFKLNSDGSANKLFATDGSLFDASTLATKTSLNGYISNQSGIIDTSVEGNVATLTLGNSADDGNIVVNKANSDTGEISYSNTIAGDSITILNSKLKRGIGITATNGFYISMLNGDDNPIMLDGASGEITAGRFVRKNGTSAQFLKADGSVDSNTYVTTNTVQALSNKTFTTVTTAKGFSAMETNNRASNKFFATDGTIQETVAITEDEINALF